MGRRSPLSGHRAFGFNDVAPPDNFGKPGVIILMFGTHPFIPKCKIKAVIVVEATIVMQVMMRRCVDPAGERRCQPPAWHQFEPGMTHRVADNLKENKGEENCRGRWDEPLPKQNKHSHYCRLTD